MADVEISSSRPYKAYWRQICAWDGTESVVTGVTRAGEAEDVRARGWSGFWRGSSPLGSVGLPLCFDLYCPLLHCYIHNGDAST